MARIIAGIGASHSPTIGFAKDNKAADDPAWAEVFKVFAPVTDWLKFILVVPKKSLLCFVRHWQLLIQRLSRSV